MSDLESKINPSNIPEHIAIIMDGNGRWAKKKGNQRIFGHKYGVAAVKEIVETCAKLKVGFLTLYAFSTENWNRPKTEVNALMALMIESLNKETKHLQSNNVILKAIGDLNSLPTKVRENLNKTIEATSNNTGITLILAISYSAKWEILQAVKNISQTVKDGNIEPTEINEEVFENHLVTSGIPNPSLLIRTSGEYRISNFLLWQLAYAELYFTDVLWPDFKKENLFDAIIDYQSRERRFGKTSEQLK